MRAAVGHLALVIMSEPSSEDSCSAAARSWDIPPPDARAFSALQFNPELRSEDIDSLKLWIRQEGLPVRDDHELVKFLHSCDYNVEDAGRCAKVFFECRKDYPELFIGFDLTSPELQAILKVIIIAIIPHRTPEGYRIIYNGLRTSDTNKYIFRDVCKMLFMALESIFLTEPTVNGIVFIHDMELASARHFFKFGITLPRVMGKYTATGMPLKQEDMYLVKCSAFIDGALKTLKQFVSKEGWEKVHVCRGSDLNGLHDRIPKHCLPMDLGGSLPSVNELADMTLKRFQLLEDAMKSIKSSSER